MPFIRKVRILFKTRLIFPRINGPIVSRADVSSHVFSENKLELKLLLVPQGVTCFCPFSNRYRKIGVHGEGLNARNVSLRFVSQIITISSYRV